MQRFFKGKKILITGNTGFKGSWLTEILLQWGADIVGVSLPPKTEPNLFAILNLEQRIKNYFLDIRDFDALKKVIADERPEIVFHLAAQPIVRISYDDPLTTYSTNALGTANVLQAIHEVGSVRAAVIITTDKVYKNVEWIYPYRENDPLGGYDPYSASKAAADIIAQSYIQSFFNPKDFGKKHQTLVAIARAGNVIGGGDWGEYRLVPDIVRSIYEKNEKVIIRSPRAIRPWEHVLEPLAGYLELASGLYAGKIEYSDAWNFGPDHESFMNVEELVKRATALLAKGTYEIREDNTKHEAGILMLDTTKAKSFLDWSPRLRFQENIDFTFSWYRNYYEKAADPIEFTDAQIKSFFNDASS
ncbi:MAG: CDP-glucose 4,6-dehydratase [Candidatus Moranbacteria bacterium RIFCSPHIGHO2_01_FULL_55_24]|nr:MAG: CDP-glucose 4,6-dehydratase [Candidatus Moranbacteria bacterium RIFCSPHIGHO2_01_FULL_55_24]